MSTFDGVLKFATKMALYQPRRTVTATVLANLIQDDFAEELLEPHKRGRTNEWIRRRATIHLPFQFDPVFGIIAGRKTIVHYHPLVQTAR